MIKRIFKAIKRIRDKEEHKEKHTAQTQAGDVFKAKYKAFKRLLDSNAEFLNIQAELEEKLRGDSVLGMGFVRSRSTMAVYQAMRMVESLNELTNNRYKQLVNSLEDINSGIEALLEDAPAALTDKYILDYDSITKEMGDSVGGKNANLGELKSRLKMPVPEGFAITTRVFYEVFKANDFFEEIKKIRMEMDLEDISSITAGSEKIQKMILDARIPGDIEKAVLSAYQDLVLKVAKAQNNYGDVRVALRSSAIGEDGEQSFAGQYVTFLNVTSDQVMKTYKFILAGLYIPRAMVYRLNKGIREEDSAMSVACLEMVDARAAGVMYTRHPIEWSRDLIFINAVWGLGESAVDGSVNPDTYMVSKERDMEVLESVVGDKEKMLVPRSDRDGLDQKDVPEYLRESPCLNPEQIKELAGLGLKVEQHYQVPQDIEWALDNDGKIRLLQTRPINYLNKNFTRQETLNIQINSDHEPIIKGGSVASQGVAFGPCFHVTSRKDLDEFPRGGVLIARQSSPQYAMVMPRAGAIITEAGSVTGHMASLTREFNVPAILGVKNALKLIPHGLEVTVDAYSARVYQGRIDSILALKQERVASMVNTPVHNILKKLAEFITPLNLSDPSAANFTPEHCRTLHDIARFVHEISYLAMFQLSDFVSDHGRISMKLDVSLPIDLYLIDLGEGLKNVPPGSTRVVMENICSLPFEALLRGMLHPELRWNQPRPIEWKGLFSVMGEQLLKPQMGQERFGDRSYAIISDKYLNFSSRVGYHYAVLDSYCGSNINKNYITFAFKGGAADDLRRGRRIRAISLVLEKLGFVVKAKGDRVDSSYRKDEQNEMESRLDYLGKLLIFTRQMDMLMFNEHCVELFAESFLNEDYTLECFYGKVGISDKKA